jgi:two-component system, response regulator PdtaR
MGGSMSLSSQDRRVTVLIVEDEPMLRWDAEYIAEKAGFDVVSARNADEAIAILESRNDIRIIFTDINMPGSMDGLKLAHAVRGRWPPIKIIVTSGHGAAVADELPAGSLFVAKPYAADTLVRALVQFTQ